MWTKSIALAGVAMLALAGTPMAADMSASAEKRADIGAASEKAHNLSADTRLSDITPVDGLEDMEVQTVAGEDVGEVEGVIRDSSGKIQGLAVEVGGFLGVGARTVELSADTVHYMAEDKILVTPMTKAQLGTMPEMDEDRVDAASGDTTATGTMATDDRATTADNRAADATVDRQGPRKFDMSRAMKIGDVPDAAVKLDGAELWTADGEEIGDIDHVIVGQDGQPEQIIAGVGGFLGIGARSIAMGTDSLVYLKDEEAWVTKMTRADIEAAPAHDDAATRPAAD